MFIKINNIISFLELNTFKMSTSTVSLASADVAEYYSEKSTALRLLHFLKKQGILRTGSEVLTDKKGKAIKDRFGKIRFHSLFAARICVGPATSQVYYPTDSLADMLSLFEKLADSGVISRDSSSSPYRTPKFGWCSHCNSAAEKFPHNYQAHGMCFSSKRQADLYEQREKDKLVEELSTGFEFDLHGNKIDQKIKVVEIDEEEVDVVEVVDQVKIVEDEKPTFTASAPEFVSQAVSHPPVYAYAPHASFSPMLVNTPMGLMWCLVPDYEPHVVNYQ